MHHRNVSNCQQIIVISIIMQTKFIDIVLRYLIFVGIPYLIACRLEKFVFSRLSLETKQRLHKKYPNKRLFPELDDISEVETKED